MRPPSVINSVTSRRHIYCPTSFNKRSGRHAVRERHVLPQKERTYFATYIFPCDKLQLLIIFNILTLLVKYPNTGRGIKPRAARASSPPALRPGHEVHRLSVIDGA